MTPFEIRAALKAAGFSPVPCNGKRIFLRGWQEMRDIPLEVMRADYYWRLYRNTGILTERAPAFDADVLIPAAAAAIEDFGKDWFDGRGLISVKFGQWPKRTLLFRTDKPFAKIAIYFTDPLGREHHIEWLGLGQQTVVHGIHPDTRQPYRWFGPEPWTIRRDDLALVGENEAHAFAEAAADMLVREFKFERAPISRVAAKRAGHNWTRQHWNWDEVKRGVDDGCRNHACAAFFGRLLWEGKKPSEALQLTLDWNSSNRPPLSERKVRTTARSITRRHIAKVRGLRHESRA
jgi:hypothetical protein